MNKDYYYYYNQAILHVDVVHTPATTQLHTQYLK